MKSFAIELKEDEVEAIRVAYRCEGDKEIREVLQYLIAYDLENIQRFDIVREARKIKSEKK